MMKLAELEEALLKLEVSARARLAERLLRSLDELPEAELVELWAEEAERRDQALDAGTLEAVPADKVFEELRARLA